MFGHNDIIKCHFCMLEHFKYFSVSVQNTQRKEKRHKNVNDANNNILPLRKSEEK